MSLHNVKTLKHLQIPQDLPNLISIISLGHLLIIPHIGNTALIATIESSGMHIE